MVCFGNANFAGAGIVQGADDLKRLVDDPVAQHFGIGQNWLCQRLCCRRDKILGNPQVAHDIGHAAGVDHANGDGFRAGRQARKIRLAANDGEGFFIDGRWVAEVIHHFFFMLTGPSGCLAWG